MTENTGGEGRRRSKKLAVGLTAMAAVLGGGAYLATDRAARHSPPAEVGALASPAPQSAPASAGEPASAAPSTTSQAPETLAAAAPQSISPEVRRSIDAARKRMREDGVEVKRPVTPAVPQNDDGIETTTKGSLKAGGIVRILAARRDLTGQRELAYVAGGVREHRDVPCSQTFQFYSSPKPAVKDNLLVCWRTTATKSVVAIVVDPKGNPSRDKAVDAIERKWKSMR